LRHEYGTEPRMMPARYTMARWVTSDDPKELKRFIEANAHRIAYDVVEAPTFLAAFEAELKVAQDLWKKIKFHALREHAGLVFQAGMSG
jgi:peptide chain release factor 3